MMRRCAGGPKEAAMERAWGQKDLGEAWFSPKLGRNARLEQISAAIDWEALEADIAPLYAGKTGRPAWPSAIMLKSLLLAGWYGLSDAGLEAALADRLSFRRFVGLNSDQGAPDRTVISRFRRRLKARGLEDGLAAQVSLQLAAQGLGVKRGLLIDARLAPLAARAEVRDAA
jgi:transposase